MSEHANAVGKASRRAAASDAVKTGGSCAARTKASAERGRGAQRTLVLASQHMLESAQSMRRRFGEDVSRWLAGAAPKSHTTPKRTFAIDRSTPAEVV